MLLTQLAIYLVAGLIGWQFLKNQSMVAGVLKQFDFSILFSGTTGMIAIFFVIGTLTFSVLAALTGSLVSNQEQVQQAAMPISMLGLVGYFITIAAQSGDSMLAQIASYVPFLNVFVMPTQMSLDEQVWARRGSVLQLASPSWPCLQCSRSKSIAIMCWFTQAPAYGSQ